MSEYWKSIPRKFCDFCKCWITDNRPSVDFHERGKRHQENVKKKIEEVKQKSLEKAKQDKELDDDIKQMEQAAMEAFKKDLASNPDLAAGYVAKLKADQDFEESLKGDKEKKENQSNGKVEKVEDESEIKEIKEWYEAKSDEGYTYYWSMITGASIWDPPDEYMSLAEQAALASTGRNTDTPADVDQEVEDTEPEVQTEEEEEEPLPLELPDICDIPLPTSDIPLPPDEDDKSSESEPDEPREDRFGARASYGKWEVVREVKPVELDLQLPPPAYQMDLCDVPIPDVPAEPKVKFKEKKVTSLGRKDGAPVAFKKRKLGSNVRSMRKRDEDV